ncbi:MAG: HAMP domain-containing histidine kinase [Acidobacteriia bacterium]|nr:HAMP domain-containing histidine kinase [Terriglobia bacterium]
MKLPIKERAFTTGMVILATIVVLVLAALQYRWSNQVSEATSIRLADSLQMSMVNWHLDFFRDFSEICIAMNADSDVTKPDDRNEYAHRFALWEKSTAHPDLVSNVYLMEFKEDRDPEVYRLDSHTTHFEPAKLTLDISPLLQELRQGGSRAASQGPSGPVNEMQNSLSQANDREFADRFYPGGPLAGWQFETSIPALVRSIPNIDTAAMEGGNTSHHGTQWIVMVLDEKTVQDQLLPDLSQRYFRGTEGLDYQVAVVARSKPEHLLYTSDSGFGEQEVTDADGTMDIFGRLQNGGTGSPIHIFQTPSENKGPAASVGITWFPLLRLNGDEQDWRLVVRHRRGGALGAFVADSRRRDLAIGFGMLFLLVISIAILIITSMRAQRLAKLQMDFVTAVSHELRTPLTVISSAAENIAHGVVEGKSQLEQYGTVIGNQARKLFDMVEQILLFAAIREGHQRYNLRPIEVAEILDAALSSTAGLVRTARFQVEQEIEPNLPQILGDLSALSQCLQNLITNALKYGSEQRWIGIQARLAEHGLHGREIQISVSDRGIGIDSGELPHIFEPFYRSPSVMAAQIHGTGLGLPLAKSIVEAMKGRLTVRSAPGHGSTFTLHLPLTENAVRHSETNAGETVSSSSSASTL